LMPQVIKSSFERLSTGQQDLRQLLQRVDSDLRLIVAPFLLTINKISLLMQNYN
jgi:hypothetical protein